MNSIMMNFSTALVFLSLGALIASLSARRLLLRYVIVLVTIPLALLIPVVDSNLWLWVNGAIGELSIVSLLLLCAYVLRKLTGTELFLRKTRIHLYGFILVAGSILYPATLGLSRFDPYIYGYDIYGYSAYGYSLGLPLLLLAFSILYWVFKQRQMSIILLAITAAQAAGLLSSLNSWDYVIDPLVWLFSPVLLLLHLFRGKKRLLN